MTNTERRMKPGRRRGIAAVVVALFAAALVSTTVGAHPGAHGDPSISPRAANLSEKSPPFNQILDAQPELVARSAVGCVNGSADGYPCDNVDLEAFMPLNTIGGTQSTAALNDIWGWTDPMTGNEYAIVGRVFGTSFVDITDPAAPIYLGELPTHGFGSSWRDVKTYDNHAFIVSEASRHGMQVFDLTQLRGLSGPPQTFAETAWYNQIGSAHNIVINEDSATAYAVGVGGRNSCSGGLHMIDISTPAAPVMSGCYSADGYTHDAQCINYNGPDTQHNGKEICFAFNEDTVTIVDVTNKSNPVQLSRVGYNQSAYTHQGWVTDDLNHMLVDDELDELSFGFNTRTRIWDISDLDNPSETGTYSSSFSAIDHNLYIKGDYAYQSNYRAGLRIIDLSGIAAGNLSEVGFFDIYPDNDNAEFNANWSNYPYFDSGIVVASGIEQGLFILRPTIGGGPADAPPSVSVTAPAAGSVVVGSTTVTATASDDMGVTQVEFFANGASIGVDTDGNDGWSASWDSTTAPDGAASVSATATDTIGQVSSDSVSVTVDNIAGGTTMHIGDIDGTSAIARGTRWTATLTMLVVDEGGAPVDNVTVNGDWSAGSRGAAACTTDASGTCTIMSRLIRDANSSVTFTVSGVVGGSLTYAPGDNTDPDGDSDGTVIVVAAP